MRSAIDGGASSSGFPHGSRRSGWSGGGSNFFGSGLTRLADRTVASGSSGDQVAPRSAARTGVSRQRSSIRCTLAVGGGAGRSFDAQLDHQAVGTGKLRRRELRGLLQIEHHARHAGLRFGDADLLQQRIADRDHVHAFVRHLGPGALNVEEQAVGIGRAVRDW